MLNFVQPRVAVHYFWLVLFGTVGTVQVVAAWYHLPSIKIAPHGWPAWAGLLLGFGVAAAALVWFVVATPGVLRPGPAGFEIAVLFAGATLAGLFFCRLIAWITGCFS